MTINGVTKSPMNYTGGKYQLIKQLFPIFPEQVDGKFYDLFCGGGDIASNVSAKKGIVANDIDECVVGIYRAFAQKSIEEVLGQIEGRINEYSLSLTNAEGYNAFRKFYNDGSRDPIDLFVLICYSFNHQIRFNSKGEFNMPFGKDRSHFNKNIKENLISFHRKIHEKKIKFTCQDFSSFDVEKMTKDDFIYCDPPYLITCASYNEQDGWNEECERRLYNFLDEASAVGVKFALSNVMENKGKENEILKEWAKKYRVIHLNKTYSNCSYHAKDRDKTTTDEVVVVNYEELRQLSLFE